MQEIRPVSKPPENAAAGDDADKITFVVDHGDKVLLSGDGEKILHARSTRTGCTVRRCSISEIECLGLAQVHHAQALERPEQVALL